MAELRVISRCQDAHRVRTHVAISHRRHRPTRERGRSALPRRRTTDADYLGRPRQHHPRRARSHHPQSDPEQPPRDLRRHRTLPALRTSRSLLQGPYRLHEHDLSVDDIRVAVAGPDAGPPHLTPAAWRARLAARPSGRLARHRHRRSPPTGAPPQDGTGTPARDSADARPIEEWADRFPRRAPALFGPEAPPS